MASEKMSDLIKVSEFLLLNRMYESSQSKMITAEISAFVNALSPEEHAKIRPVLERDLEFQKRERARINSLKTTVALGKSSSNNSDMGDRNISVSSESLGSQASLSPSNGSSAASPNNNSKKCCKTCGNQLGFIFNSGGKCRKCLQPICDSCKCFVDLEKKQWLCNLCFQKRELMAASNEWFYHEPDGRENISEVLLLQMRRATLHRLAESSNNMEFSKRPLNYNPRRNMSLPPIASENLLQVPSEHITTEHPMRALHRFIQNNVNNSPINDSIEENDSEIDSVDTTLSENNKYLEVKARYPFARPRSPTR